ncbi:MAG TPA: lysophospholipid acyltransferase family protein [Acidimicrobiales bacterium]|nr:lysophospholipid acyltransferase family protein [Acidimicrobiales bacterium]
MKLPLRPSFPIGPPTWPTGVELQPPPRRTGVHYDTDWARRWPARVARAVFVDDLLRPLVAVLGSPLVTGLDRLADLEAPAIFAANHHSHLDTPLVLTSLPARFRHRAVVAAAADYFFSSRVKSAYSALTIGAIPIERTKVNRRSSDLAASLIDGGWNLVVFPEGGRSPDGWGQDFRGGAAYLAIRCQRPVVPVYVEGTRRILKKGAQLPTPIGRPFARGTGVRVTFGKPLWAQLGEDSRRFAVRVEAAVAELGDETATDWWTARRRAAAGTTPSLTGPTTAPWRRAWALDDQRRRRGADPTWP